MQNDDDKSIPRLPPGWQTGSMRKKERGGDHTIHTKRMQVLAETLAKEIAEQVTGGNLAEAAAMVKANLIDMRQPNRGSSAVAASPDSQRLLDQQEAPKLLSSWQTGNMRTKEWGGSSRTYIKRMHALAETLAKDIAMQVTGGNLAEAAALVEANLIGMRQPARGAEVFAANPDAQRLLNESENRWRLVTTRRDDVSKNI